MGVALAVLLYIAYMIFLGRIAWRFLLLLRVRETDNNRSVRAGGRMRVLLHTGFDMLFLSKLFRSNWRLWLGEWLFHAAFVFVVIRHLRFIVDPVPAWLISYQAFGIFSGYLLAGSLIFTSLYKILTERSRYISGYNFLILSLLLFVSLTGLLMRTYFKTDVFAAKEFMLGAVTFNPAPAPEGIFFLIHYTAALLFFILLPTHIFSAPYTLMEARKREEALRLVMHEK
jgi:nitrate reductase gamma subunit